jgi:hypothetical protein
MMTSPRCLLGIIVLLGVTAITTTTAFVVPASSSSSSSVQRTATATTTTSTTVLTAKNNAGDDASEADLLRFARQSRSASSDDNVVELMRPLGLVLNQDDKGNVYVETVAPKGNAARTGKVCTVTIKMCIVLYCILFLTQETEPVRFMWVDSSSICPVEDWNDSCSFLFIITLGSHIIFFVCFDAFVSQSLSSCYYQ